MLDLEKFSLEMTYYGSINRIMISSYRKAITLRKGPFAGVPQAAFCMNSAEGGKNLSTKAGTCVPIGYNKDKRQNLVIAMGFGFVLILFPLKRPLKTGFEIGGDNRGCYIKDKNIWEILEGILWHTILK